MPPMSLRIAVIADTHGRLPEKILPDLAKADEIWHLGDFCDLKTLSDCLAIGRPFYAVLGNNDHGLDLPLFARPPREEVAAPILLHP